MAKFAYRKSEEIRSTQVSSVVADCQHSPTSINQKVSGIRIRAASRMSNSCMGESKRAGPIVVLTWNFIDLVIYNFVMKEMEQYIGRKYAYFAFIVIPVSGLVADSFVGRYKFIKGCKWIMWLASFVLCLTYLVSYPNLKEDGIPRTVRIAAFFLLHVGMGCSQVNMIQFAMDQLQDAPSAHIISYIKWHAWTYFASVCTVSFTQYCTCIQYQAVVSLLPFGLLSYVLCSDFLLNDVLVKEPVLQNPLKLIYGVLNFSARNKYPQLRNSHPYWSAKRCFSRINLAKAIYGGPFSNGEVEDVKTFFRMCIIFVFAAIIMTAAISVETLNCEAYGSVNVCSDFTSCLSNQLVLKSGYCFILVCIPACELLLPVIRKKLPYLKILVRMAIGGFCCLLSLVIVLTLAVSNQLPSKCINSVNVSQTWSPVEKHEFLYMIPSLLNCIGRYLGMMTGIEFICAQCPYTMKGLIYGVLYLFLGIDFTLFFYLDSVVKFKTIKIHHNIVLEGSTYGILINTTVVILFGFISVIGIRCYKARKRGSGDEIYDTYINEDP